MAIRSPVTLPGHPISQQQLGPACLYTITMYLRYIALVELVETMRWRSWNSP